MASAAVVEADGVKMTLKEKFVRHLKEGRFFNNEDRVVVATSTGVDSMVLLNLLLHLPKELRPQLTVAHVNHELRSQSKIEEEYIQQYSKDRNLHLAIHHWEKKDHPETGIEEAARKERYNFFAQVMKDNNASILVTAHHLNDLAETMLMKLVRGGKLSQLIGIEESRAFATGKLVRPLLHFPKEELIEYARQNNLKWYEDETNSELTVQRNRFRHEIIPLMLKENPKFLEGLLNYHDQLTTSLHIQKEYADGELEKLTLPNGRLDLKGLDKYEKQRQKVIIERWLTDKGIINQKKGAQDQLLRDINNRQLPQFIRELGTEITIVKDYSELYLQNPNQFLQNDENEINSVIELDHWYPIMENREIMVGKREDFFLNEGENYQEMWLAPDQLPLTIRRWQSHDLLSLKNGGHQKVERILIDQKVSLNERKNQLVIADAAGAVVWVIGKKWGWFARPVDYKEKWCQLFIGMRGKKGENNE